MSHCKCVLPIKHMSEMPVRKNADSGAAKYHRMTPVDDGFIDKQVNCLFDQTVLKYLAFLIVSFSNLKYKRYCLVSLTYH